MPFTGSHPAAVLPLLRVPYLREVPTALVIGSMVPDLPYYLPTRFVGSGISFSFTHTLTGVLTIDLLMGLLCIVVWHGLVGPAAVLAAPAALRARLRDGEPRPVGVLLRSPRNVALLVLGLVVGAVTHVVWDSFTHWGRFGAQHIAWLATMHGPLAGYRWAQYASGAVGAVVIAAWCVNWWRTTRPVATPSTTLGPAARSSVWAGVAGGLVLGAVVGLAVARIHGDGLRHTLWVVATTGGGAMGLAGLLAAGFVVLSAASGTTSGPASE